MMFKTFLILVIFSLNLFSQAVIDYGFEDWSGNANTTPGYIFTASAPDYWNNHVTSTEVVSSCSGNTAYEGTYFLHRQFWTGGSDPCLGPGTATSVNDHGNIGGNFTYPNQGYGNNISLATAITSDTLTFRFYFRLNGWKAQAGILNWCKFIRIHGTGTGYFILYTYPQNNSNNDMSIADYLTYGNYTGHTGIDFQDGNWHCITCQVIIVGTGNNNIRGRIWMDDWDMENAPFLDHLTSCPNFGNGFSIAITTQNFSASNPAVSMSADFDKFEIWNGSPTTSFNPPPSQVQGIQVTAQ